jgi:hypothetical protein
VIELAAPLPVAPIELTRVGKWLERVPGLRLDGERPTSRALAARLAAYWLPRQTVLYVGSTAGSIGSRLAALDSHVLGDARPHAAAQWLRALDVTGLRAWWAVTDAAEEYEDALLESFAAGVPDSEREALPERSVVLPFANLRTPTGARRAHGITGAVLPVEARPERPPTRVVALPPGTPSVHESSPAAAGRCAEPRARLAARARSAARAPSTGPS